MNKIITFNKSALKDLCKIMNIPYDENIIAFTKEGIVTNICDLIQEVNDIGKEDREEWFKEENE